MNASTRQIICPPGKLCAPKHRSGGSVLTSRPRNLCACDKDLETLGRVDQHIEAVDDELERLTTVEPWAKFYPYLVQLPGFGIVVAMTTLAAIGDIAHIAHD